MVRTDQHHLKSSHHCLPSIFCLQIDEVCLARSPRLSTPPDTKRWLRLSVACPSAWMPVSTKRERAGTKGKPQAPCCPANLHTTAGMPGEHRTGLCAELSGSKAQCMGDRAAPQNAAGVPGPHDASSTGSICNPEHHLALLSFLSSFQYYFSVATW